MCSSPLSPLDGLARLRAGTATAGGGVPFEQVLPMPMADVSRGRMQAALPSTAIISDFAQNGLAGHLIALVDRTLGGAILSVLGPGRAAMTISLRVDLCAVESLAPPVTCSARVFSEEPTTALATGEIRGPDGVSVGHAVLRSFLFDLPPPTALSSAESARRTADYEPAATSGPPLDLAWFRPFPADDVEYGERSAAFRCATRAPLTNSLGVLHGGAAAILIDLAGALALRHVLGDETTTPLDVTVRYLRPAPARSLVQGHATVTNMSRSLVTLSHELRGPDGRVAVEARSTRLRDRGPREDAGGRGGGDAVVPG